MWFFSHVIIAVVLMSLPFAVQADEELKRKVKAAFISKFIDYVAFGVDSRKTESIIVGVYPKSFKDEIEKLLSKNGDRTIITDIDHALSGKSNAKKILIVDDCEHLTRILDGIDTKNIFLIGHDTENCLDNLHIELFLIENKYGFGVNRKNLERDNIKVDSRLLKLAKKVIQENE